MRTQWRLLLRHHHRHTVSSRGPLLHHHHNHQVTTTTTPSPPPHFPTFFTPRRHFTAEPPTTETTPNQPSLFLTIFSKTTDPTQIQTELDSNNLTLTHDLILTSLDQLKPNPATAINFWGWILENHSQKLSSKTYNVMLKVLVNNGYVKEFWSMVDAMKAKGYGVSKGTSIEALRKFNEDGLLSDVDKLNALFSKEVDNVGRVSKIVKKGVWDENVETELGDLGVSYSSGLVKVVLEKLDLEPMKGLIFFRWVQESGLCEHDGVSYNAMAVVLGREDCIDRFWNVLDEMRNAGFEMERETFVTVMGRFVKRKMLNDAVGVYEFAMNGRMNKPSKEDCTYLLRKIAGAEKLDIDLFSRVVRVYTEKGSALQDSMLDAVLKSLTGGGKMREYNKVFQAMLECGYRPSGPMQARVAFDLSSSRMQDEANEFIVKLEEACGLVPDYKTWVALIEGSLVAGDFRRAEGYLQKVIDVEGVANAGYLLNMLVNAYCHRNKPAEACKVLVKFVDGEGLTVKAWHTTYKMLVSKLLVQKGFQDALGLLKLMKNDGFPPFLDPFIAYLSRKGKADEAMLFFKAMTVNKYPSTSVFVQVFEAFSKAGRHREAQNLLAICPQYIRNDADVLELFCTMKSEEPVKPAPVAV